MTLHCLFAHAGRSAPLDIAGSPARRGWPRWQLKALMEEADVSDDAVVQTANNPGAPGLTCFAIAGAVYTGGQMLEIHPKNCHFCHFSGRRRGIQAERLGQ
jgi:hypothetical protein